MRPLHIELREEREKGGITLKAIHSSTRISMACLQALEQETLDFLEVPYVRLILRTYAEQVGVDPQYVLKRYEELTGTVPPALVLEETEEHEALPMRMIGVVSVSALMVLIVIVLAVWLSRPGENREKRLTERPAPPRTTELEKVGAGMSGPAEQVPADASVPTPQKSGQGTEERSPEASPAADHADPLPLEGDQALHAEEQQLVREAQAEASVDSILVLEAEGIKDTTWVQVQMDEGEVFQGMLLKGDRKVWKTRDRFHVTSGKAQGIALTFQGRYLGILGDPYSILRVILSREGVQILGPRGAVRSTPDTTSPQKVEQTEDMDSPGEIAP